MSRTLFWVSCLFFIQSHFYFSIALFSIVISASQWEVFLSSPDVSVMNLTLELDLLKNFNFLLMNPLYV